MFFEVGDLEEGGDMDDGDQVLMFSQVFVSSCRYIIQTPPMFLVIATLLRFFGYPLKT